MRHGHSRTYDYPLVDDGKPERASIDWYHDHRMDRTTRNNWMGLQGMFVTTDRRENTLNLPRGRYDVPLMVSERSFTDDNQLTKPFPKHPSMVVTGPQAPPGDGTVGTHILANGRYAPFLKVSTHRYRLRLLNASPLTSYDFHLSDGRPFVQIGTGSGLLRRSVVRQDILLGPAQRADVIVDFHKELGDNVVLESIPRTDDAPGGIGSPSAAIMAFRVVRTADRDPTRIPRPAPVPTAAQGAGQVSKVWRFDVAGDPDTGSYWTVNGKMFDPDRVDYRVPLGSKETWKLVNNSPVTHYIHIHEEQWHTVSRDGKRPPPWERGLEDTWRLDPGEYVTVAARFTDYRGTFMIHCHMLDHEDHGLMAQFKVVKPRSGTANVRPVGYRTAPVAPAEPLPVRGALLSAVLNSRSAPEDFLCEP